MRGVRGFGWVAVVPVKRLPLAKTRLRGALPGVPHERLVVAMALDTVAAVLACARVHRVLVVTDDPLAGPALTELGAQRVGHEPAGGLNPALAYGASRAGARARVVALTADLPALRPAELDAALDAAARLAGTGPLRSYVPDATGRGTALLAALGGTALAPRFGPGSAAAHAASGAVRLDGDWPSLRRDVDTPEDLAAAIALGLGRYTAELVGAARYGVRE
jgi:2-phospho-L-lactate guanylyltransferase